MINYIEIIDKSKIKINNNKTTKVLNVAFNVYINQLLLKDLTTLKGRIEAIKEKYNYHKLIPIYIDDALCLIPIEKKENNYIYINIFNIFKVVEHCIVFIDGGSITVNKNTKTLNKYISRAKVIKK